MDSEYKNGVLIRDDDVERALGSMNLSSDKFSLAYRGHVYRILNFTHRQVSGHPIAKSESRALSIAAAFHDIAVFSDGTWDYLDRSVAYMHRWLKAEKLEEQAMFAELLVRNHHCLRTYSGPHRRFVEAFRRADLIDFPGWRQFGLTLPEIHEVRSAFPSQGFQRRLWLRILKEALFKPWNPVPMVRLQPFVFSGRGGEKK